MARPRETSKPYNDAVVDFYDDYDVNVGDFVYARDMKHAITDDEEAADVMLYYQETTLKTGPVWVQGWWRLAPGETKGKWWTPFGNLGKPTAWAPLPKNKDE